MAGQTPRVLIFWKAQGQPEARVSRDLEAPWDVAVGNGGLVYVSDNGASQQIKEFSPYGGQMLRAVGRRGGRP